VKHLKREVEILQKTDEELVDVLRAKLAALTVD
jgi:hypothetical protein